MTDPEFHCVINTNTTSSEEIQKLTHIRSTLFYVFKMPTERPLNRLQKQDLAAPGARLLWQVACGEGTYLGRTF